MGEITRSAIARVGVDLAKNVIQVHAVDATGRRVTARSIKRDQFLAWCAQLPAGCPVAMEACSSAHHWARRLRAMGLDARLIAGVIFAQKLGQPACVIRAVLGAIVFCFASGVIYVFNDIVDRELDRRHGHTSQERRRPRRSAEGP